MSRPLHPWFRAINYAVEHEISIRVRGGYYFQSLKDAKDEFRNELLTFLLGVEAAGHKHIDEILADKNTEDRGNKLVVKMCVDHLADLRRKAYSQTNGAATNPLDAPGRVGDWADAPVEDPELGGLCEQEVLQMLSTLAEREQVAVREYMNGEESTLGLSIEGLRTLRKRAFAKIRDRMARGLSGGKLWTPTRKLEAAYFITLLERAKLKAWRGWRRAVNFPSPARCRHGVLNFGQDLDPATGCSICQSLTFSKISEPLFGPITVTYVSEFEPPVDFQTVAP